MQLAHRNPAPVCSNPQPTHPYTHTRHPQPNPAGDYFARLQLDKANELASLFNIAAAIVSKSRAEGWLVHMAFAVSSGPDVFFETHNSILEIVQVGPWSPTPPTRPPTHKPHHNHHRRPPTGSHSTLRFRWLCGAPA